MRYLLDTCSFLWLCAAPERLSEKARDVLSQGGAELILSDVTALEIALKWLAGKIRLPAPPRSWVEEQAGLWSLVRAPISRTAIYHLTELPTLHADPFDRLLVATALEEDATIVTPDESIQRYPVAWAWWPPSRTTTSSRSPTIPSSRA